MNPKQLFGLIAEQGKDEAKKEGEFVCKEKFEPIKLEHNITLDKLIKLPRIHVHTHANIG